MITKFTKFLFLLLFILFLIVGADYFLNHYYFKSHLPNLRIKRINFSKEGRLRIIYPDGEKVFEKEELGVRLNLSKFFVLQRQIRENYSYLPVRLGLYFGLVKIEVSPEIEFSKKPLREFLEILKDRYNTPAVDAKFVFKNGKVREFRKEKEGREVDEKAFWKEVDKKIKNWLDQRELKVEVKIVPVEPKVKLSDINTFGIEELIASGSSSFRGSIWQREHNIVLATQRLSGTVVPRDKIFSFNRALGEVSVATGYKQSYIIKDGRTILGDGGGVCQVSTTLFRAVLNAGLPIVERHAHSYRVGYYEQDSKPGFDATVFAPSVDFKFKNNTPAYVLIEGKVDRKRKKLYFYLYGKKDGRRVFISKPRIYDVVPPPEPLYIEDPTLPPGAVKQIDFPAWGAKVVFTYRVERDGKILFRKVFKSVYKPWQAVYLVGKN